MFANQPDDAQLVALWHDPATCQVLSLALRRRSVGSLARDRLLKRLIAVHGEPRFDLFNSRRPTRS
jgi:hypothetical protein